MTDYSLQNRLLQVIDSFITSPENTLQNQSKDPAFDPPLVGYARGDDPIFTQYKEVVGPYHWTPAEAFQLGFPGKDIPPETLTVVSWILPHTIKTKMDNRRQKHHPSESWCRARIFGEQVNEILRKKIVDYFTDSNIDALAPVIHPAWSRKDSDRYVWSSTWSERHMAYAAGLGTFGLCDGLITPKGKAMRTGSVVVRTTDLPISARPYADHHAYCLFHSTGSCLKCANRCPAGAISAEGHDKIACRNYVHQTCRDYISTAYGLDGYGCGLCQTGVPCESRIPLKNKK